MKNDIYLSTRVFLECSQIHKSKINTGIQRVVRNIVKYSFTDFVTTMAEVNCVALQDNHLVLVPTQKIIANELKEHGKRGIYKTSIKYLNKFLRILAHLCPTPKLKIFILAPVNEPGLKSLVKNLFIKLKKIPTKTNEPVALNSISQPGDILLLIDASWGLNIWGDIEIFIERGGCVKALIYDLIPIKQPEFIGSPSKVAEFKDWVTNCLKFSDQLIAISKTTAFEITSFAKEQNINMPTINYFYLGCELDTVEKTFLSTPISKLLSQGFQTFITVGSIEPRKNHAYLIDAFENLWKKGHAARLLIIGKEGWSNSEILKRIKTHHEYNKKLFLLSEVTDSELLYAYKNADGLIFPSKIEGFGLPIVEAFKTGLPVYCSNIPIFLEIAKDRAIFFELNDCRTLSDQIEKHQSKGKKFYNWPNWEESTSELFKLILKKH